MSYDVCILTASDRGAAGQCPDESGPLLRRMLTDAGYNVADTGLLSDDPAPLREKLLGWCEQDTAALIFTTGGTGIAPRDTMPEVTLSIADKVVPGIAEAMRAHSMTITPYAMISRATSVICRRTLIVNLPGSPKAVREILTYLLPSLPHILQMLRGDTAHSS